MYNYAVGSTERAALTAALERAKKTVVDIPIIINGQEIRTGQRGEQRCPYDHKKVVATFYESTSEQAAAAIEGALKAKQQWENLPFHARTAIFRKVSHLTYVNWF